MKKVGKTIWRIFLAIIIISAVIGVIRVIIHPELIDEAGSNAAPTPTATQQPTPEPAATEQPQQETAQQTDGYGWTSYDYTVFRSIVKMTADSYITDYKTPWGDDDWRFALFDSEGKIIVMTDFTLGGNPQAQTGICIFSLGPDADSNGTPDSFTPHFFSVGDTIYANDGSCDATFEKIAQLFS